jgi:hypothetical protein
MIQGAPHYWIKDHNGNYNWIGKNEGVLFTQRWPHWYREHRNSDLSPPTLEERKAAGILDYKVEGKVTSEQQDFRDKFLLQDNERFLETYEGTTMYLNREIKRLTRIVEDYPSRFNSGELQIRKDQLEEVNKRFLELRPPAMPPAKIAQMVLERLEKEEVEVKAFFDRLKNRRRPGGNRRRPDGGGPEGGSGGGSGNGGSSAGGSDGGSLRVKAEELFTVLVKVLKKLWEEFINPNHYL